MRPVGKRIQVFLVGDSSCEVNGELVGSGVKNEMLHVTVLDEIDGKTQYGYSFPLAQVRMVRLYNAEVEGE